MDLKKNIETMRSHREHFWAFMDNMVEDNKLIIIGVIIIAFSAELPDVYKYVIGGLLGYMSKTEKKGA